MADSDTDQSRQAGATEIAITPQMIEAGLEAYSELALDLDDVPRERVVSDIFTAMAKASSKGKVEASERLRSNFQEQ